MKITKRQLKRIIKEEKRKLVREAAPSLGFAMEDNPQMMDLWNQILHVIGSQFPDIRIDHFGDKIYEALEEEWMAAAEEQDEFNQENRGGGAF